MKKRKRLLVVVIFCIHTFAFVLSGCGKKDDESTAIAITPTPADTVAASETPATTPEVSANTALGVSANTGGTSTSFTASGNTMLNTGISPNPTDSVNKITGTIVAASMNDVTVRTSEGAEYTCSTTTAANNLTGGITLGNNITVTLASMSAVNGLYTATELNDINSPDTNTAGTVNNTSNTYTNNTVDDGTVYDNSSIDDGTIYDNDVTDDGSLYYDDSGVDESTFYDDGSGYYYDPSSEIYDDSYAY